MKSDERPDNLRKTQVILSDEIVRRLDEEASLNLDSRSHLIREACLDLLKRRAGERIAAKQAA